MVAGLATMYHSSRKVLSAHNVRLLSHRCTQPLLRSSFAYQSAHLPPHFPNAPCPKALLTPGYLISVSLLFSHCLIPYYTSLVVTKAPLCTQATVFQPRIDQSRVLPLFCLPCPL